MKTAICHLVSSSPYSQSRFYSNEVPKLPKERPDEYEDRTWRHRLHWNKEGFVEIPGTSFSNCIKGSAKRLQLQIPGKGKTQYTKYFEAGIMCPQNLTLNIKADDVPRESLHVPSDGKRGGSKRVIRHFPRIDSWEGNVAFYVFDDVIGSDVFKQVLVSAGLLVGIGRFRPENCGFYGRFLVKTIKWMNEEETMRAIGAAA